MLLIPIPTTASTTRSQPLAPATSALCTRSGGVAPATSPTRGCPPNPAFRAEVGQRGAPECRGDWRRAGQPRASPRGRRFASPGLSRRSWYGGFWCWRTAILAGDTPEGVGYGRGRARNGQGPGRRTSRAGGVWGLVARPSGFVSRVNGRSRSAPGGLPASIRSCHTQGRTMVHTEQSAMPRFSPVGVVPLCCNIH